MNHLTFNQRLELLELAESPETPSEILDEIFDYLTCSHSETRYGTCLLSAIIVNRTTSLKTLNKILEFPNFRDLLLIRHWISGHPNANEELILKCRAQLLKGEL